MNISTWSVRDVTMVGVTAAISIIFGVVIKVLLGPIIGNIPGASQFLISMLQAIIISLAIMKLPKVGFLTLLGIITGSIYGFIFPGQLFLFVAFIAAGLVGDVVAVLLGGFPGKAALCGGVASFRLTIIFLGMVLAYWFGYSDTALAWTLLLVGAAASAIGAVVGVMLALRLSKDLQKAGVLAPIKG